MHQAGLNIMAFCKEFNARTQGIMARRFRGLPRALSIIARSYDAVPFLRVSPGGCSAAGVGHCVQGQELRVCAFTNQPPGALCTRSTSRRRLQVVKNPPATYFIKKAAGALRLLPPYHLRTPRR